jgi:stage V sporulation protein AB
MMHKLVADSFLILVGLAGGLAVGSGMVAFLIVLDIIPRLAQLTRSYRYTRRFEMAVVLGSVVWTVVDFFDIAGRFNPLGTAVIGLFCGAFVGMLAAALTEVINVLPILAKRMRMADYMMWMIAAMIAGKVFGSLFDWLVYYSG